VSRRPAGAVVMAAGALLCDAAAAGALDECYQRAQSRLEVTPCLNALKKAATDAMLEQYLAVDTSLAELEQVTGRGGKTAALKQSQRDFERYLASHCQVVLRAFDSGTGAGQAQLACEVDLLRSRAELLKRLAPEQPKPKE
jgi:uncharacterized protein YecT (DUF1311 family)